MSLLKEPIANPRGSSTEVDHHGRQQEAEETTGRSLADVDRALHRCGIEGRCLLCHVMSC